MELCFRDYFIRHQQVEKIDLLSKRYGLIYKDMSLFLKEHLFSSIL